MHTCLDGYLCSVKISGVVSNIVCIPAWSIPQAVSYKERNLFLADSESMLVRDSGLVKLLQKFTQIVLTCGATSNNVTEGEEPPDAVVTVDSEAVAIISYIYIMVAIKEIYH